MRRLSLLFLVGVLSVLAVGQAQAQSVKCDKHKRTDNPKVIAFGGSEPVALQMISTACWIEKGVPRHAGDRRGLKDAAGKVLIPERYNTIIPLSSAHSLVEVRKLGGGADQANGWHVYMHGEGPGPRLAYSRFHVLPGGRGHLKVVVGEGSEPPAQAMMRRVGLITSAMTTVKDIEAFGLSMNPDLQSNQMGHIIWEKGLNWAVERYGDNAVVVHRAIDKSQMLSMAGEPISPVMSRIFLFGRGRDAVVSLMQLQHPDLPEPDTQKSTIIGRSTSLLYLPLDTSGVVMPLPPGAIGVMLLPGDPNGLGTTAVGWAIVYPRGEGFEVAYGTGSLASVLGRASSLPRYAGLAIRWDRVAVKEPASGQWNVLARTTLAADPMGLTNERTAAGAYRIYDQRERARDAALRQANAERQARAAAERARLAEEARQKSDAERARLQALFDRHPCNWELRRGVFELGDDRVRAYYERCGITSQEELPTARRVGVSNSVIQSATNRLWREPAATARVQYNASTSALTGAQGNWSAPIGAAQGAYGAQQQRYAWEQQLKRQIGF